MSTPSANHTRAPIKTPNAKLILSTLVLVQQTERVRLRTQIKPAQVFQQEGSLTKTILFHVLHLMSKIQSKIPWHNPPRFTRREMSSWPRQQKAVPSPRQPQQNWLWNVFAKSGILLIRHNHDFNSLIWCSLTKRTIPWRVFSALGANTGEWVTVILADKTSAFSSYSFRFHQLLSEANRGRLYSSIWKPKASVLTTLRLIWEDRRLRSLWIPPKGAALSSQKTPCPAQSQILSWTLQERFTRCIQALCWILSIQVSFCLSDAHSRMGCRYVNKTPKLSY